MTTVRDIGSSALREIGVLAAGENMSASQASDVLSRLNRKIDSWATERLTIYQITRSTWTISSGTGTYTVGSGGDVNIARPVYIEHVNYQDTSTSPVLERQLQPLTDDAWSQVPMKTQTSALPTVWYYNPTYPLGTLDLWPVPTSSTLQGVIYHAAAVAQFSAITDTVALPPGYWDFLVTNLAVALAPEYNAPINPVLIQEARDAKANVKRANIRPMDMSMGPGVPMGHSPYWRGWYSIYSGP